MGGGGSQVVGYRYYLGMHCVFTHGPVDAFQRLQFDKRTAWEGATGSAVGLYCNKPELFGGEDREGGVGGYFDFLNGESTQGRSAYLQSKLGSAIPAFRGVSSVVLKSFYLGMNPYLKPMSARLQRIHKTTNGVQQWYDTKAEIAAVGFKGGIYTFDATTAHTTQGYNSFEASITLDDGETSSVQMYGGAASAYSPVPSDNTPNPGHKPWKYSLNMSKDGGAPIVFYPEEFDTPEEAAAAGDMVGPISITGPGTFYFYLVDADTAAYNNRGAATFGIGLIGLRDMNPAHIIRECLTDGDWGMGYQASDIDDTSFMAAADALFNESFGLSMLWDKQMSIEEFIKEVIRHINAALYVDRTTGKFVLKLIRADYDVNDVLVLDEDSITKVDDFTRPAFGDLINQVTINYQDGGTNNTGSAQAEDTALVQMQGSVIGTTVQYQGVSNLQLASILATRDLHSLSTPLLSCTVYANRKASSLNIGDVFLLDWPDLLEAPTVMRVMGLAFGDGRSNIVKVTASEDIFSMPQAALTTSAPPTWTDPSSQPPEPVNDRVTCEAPYFELVKRLGASDAAAQLANTPDSGLIMSSGRRPGSAINATVLVDSGAGYASQGLTDFSPSAYLDGDIAELTTTLAVSDFEDMDLLAPGMHAQIDDELVGVTAVDLTAGTVTVGRGVMDTVPAKHAIGASLISWGTYAGLGTTQYVDGESIDVKLQTLSGGGLLDPAYAPVDTVLMSSRAIRPYPPGQVKVGGASYPSTASGTFTVTWKHRNRVTQADTLVDTTAGDVTPEVNTRYGLRFLDASDALLVERTDIGPGTASVVLDYTGDVTMELYSITDNGSSMQRHSVQFAYTPPGGTVVSAITATAYTPVDDSTIIDGGGA